MKLLPCINFRKIYTKDPTKDVDASVKEQFKRDIAHLKARRGQNLSERKASCHQLLVDMMKVGETEEQRSHDNCHT